MLAVVHSREVLHAPQATLESHLRCRRLSAGQCRDESQGLARKSGGFPRTSNPRLSLCGLHSVRLPPPGQAHEIDSGVVIEKLLLSCVCSEISETMCPSSVCRKPNARNGEFKAMKWRQEPRIESSKQEPSIDARSNQKPEFQVMKWWTKIRMTVQSNDVAGTQDQIQCTCVNCDQHLRHM